MYARTATREELEALEQGSEPWHLARCGSLGASQIADATARTKSGWGASRANLMGKLLAERVSGLPQDTYQNAAMLWGIEHEADARAAYEFRTDSDVRQVGLIPHPKLYGTHASPDGLAGAVGVEFKCPNVATHLETLLGAPIPAKYLKQMYWQMACAPELECVDLGSYDPRVAVPIQLHVQTVERNDKAIAELEEQAAEFLEELEARHQRICELYGIAR